MNEEKILKKRMDEKVMNVKSGSPGLINLRSE